MFYLLPFHIQGLHIFGNLKNIKYSLLNAGLRLASLEGRSLWPMLERHSRHMHCSVTLFLLPAQYLSLPVTAFKFNIIKVGRNFLANFEVEGVYMYMTWKTLCLDENYRASDPEKQNRTYESGTSFTLALVNNIHAPAVWARSCPGKSMSIRVSYNQLSVSSFELLSIKNWPEFTKHISFT